MDILIRPIGIIRTPYQTPAGTPIQPAYGLNVEGEVIVDPEFEAALTDIDGFDRLWLIYWLDRAGRFQPQVTPYRDSAVHGALATRTPCRPNKIGLSSVRLLGRKGRILRIADIDILDGTPLLDIKPYVPAFDAHIPSAAGWFDTSREDRRVADDRFHK